MEETIASIEYKIADYVMKNNRMPDYIFANFETIKRFAGYMINRYGCAKISVDSEIIVYYKGAKFCVAPQLKDSQFILANE